MEAFVKTPIITRIDLTQNGERGVLVEEWFEGWTMGKAPDRVHVEPEAVILRLLPKYDGLGFTSEMCDQFHGRSLRGEIVRIDFVEILHTWHVRKFPFGWTAKTHPLTDETKGSDFDLEASLMWCEQNGWNVRRWPGGGRAFKGEPMPVRTAAAIMSMRRNVEKTLFAGQMDARRAFDLAIDF
jgi:hypothetical protein